MMIMSEEMGGALTAASIIKIAENKAMAFYKAPPDSAQAFLRLTNYLKTAFATNTKMNMGDHYILDLKNHQLLVALIIGEYQWCIVFNKAKCTLGLFRNVIMPKVIRLYNEMN